MTALGFAIIPDRLLTPAGFLCVFWWARKPVLGGFLVNVSETPSTAFDTPDPSVVFRSLGADSAKTSRAEPFGRSYLDCPIVQLEAIHIDLRFHLHPRQNARATPRSGP